MDVSLVIRERLSELGLEQKDLARAARVTESYVSQLLTRKRPPPAPSRTDIYDKMDKLLRLPAGELARLAEQQRRDALKRELGEEPAAPRLREVRALLFAKCDPATVGHVRAVFEQQPFGEIERLVTQRVLDVVKRVAREELDNQEWLHEMARLGRRSYEEMRVLVLDFLDTDIFRLSAAHCASFLDPLIESWSIDLATFDLDVTLNPRVIAGGAVHFAYVEQSAPAGDGSGLQEFLDDPRLSGTATDQEINLLRRLPFPGRPPTGLYYYRALQNLRDPLNFKR